MSRIKSVKVDSNGFSAVWLLGFAAIILISGMIIFDMTGVYIQREKLVTAADAASSAGASAIDEAYLASDGSVRLDSGLAPQRCKELLVKYGSPGGDAQSVLNPASPKTNCYIDIDGDPTGNSIISNASGKVKFSFLLKLLGVDSKELTVSSRARTSCSDSKSC